MVTGVGGKLPSPLVVMPIGAMTPGDIRTPAVTAGKPVPDTVTIVPRAPAVGKRVIVGTTGTGGMVNGAVAVVR